MTTVSLFFNAVFQVIIFSLIPFLWWLATARKKERFFTWIGFKKVKSHYLLIAVVVVLFCAVSVVSQKVVVPYLLPPGATVQQSYAGQGTASIVPRKFYFEAFY